MSARSVFLRARGSGARAGRNRRLLSVAMTAVLVVALVVAPGFTASAATAPSVAAAYTLGLKACVDANYIGAEGWPANATIELSFDNDADPANGVIDTDQLICDAAGIAWRPGAFDIQSGQYIHATSGAYSATMYVDPACKIAGASSTADTVWGTGPAAVSYECFTHDGVARIKGAVAGNGTWSADLSSRGLEPGDAGGVAFMFGPHQLYRQWAAADGGTPPGPGPDPDADVVPPVTTASGISTGWVRTDVDVTLSATDQGGSGVEHTFFKRNSEAQQTYPSCVVSAEGENLLHYWSVDGSGNVEPEKHVWVHIDKTAPTTTYGGPAQIPEMGTVSLIATDSASHVDYTLYSIDGGVETTYTAPFTCAKGARTIRFHSVDNAGNIEKPVTLALTVGTPPRVDTVAPVTSVSGIPSTWTKSSVTFKLTAEDDAGGSGLVASYYKLGSGPQQTYSGAYTVAAEGTTMLRYWSVDASGNVEAEKTAQMKIDKTAPTTSYTGPTTLPAMGMVTLNVADALSGVAQTRYTIDGSTEAAYSGPFVCPSGQRTLRFWSVDNAGNAQQPVTVALTVGATLPTPPVVSDPETPAVPATTTITIRTSLTGVARGRSFVLTGLLSSGTVGDPVIVYVKKPGKAYWSYSSKRLAYRMAGTGIVEYWYRYTPQGRTSPRGLYSFKAAFPGDAARKSCVSEVITVRVR